MSCHYSKISICGLFFVITFVITVPLTTLDFESVYAPKGSGNVVLEKANVDEKDKLVVVSNINLQNIPKTGMLKVVGVINGEGFIKDIFLDEIEETKQKLKVKFVMNKDNKFVNASKPDEFFVCAYHLEDTKQNYNSVPYFDCDEGDLAGSDATTIARLFNPTSQVFAKSAYHYDMNSPSKETSFATMDDDYTSKDDSTINSKDIDSNNSDKPVKVKIIVPMKDKKNAEKIKIMAMLKGQIKSAVIDDVQKEFDKIGGYTIERTLAFDRNTDMGPIQVGDRFHACVIGEDLSPPEGSECEKRLIKDLEGFNPLAVR